jgi:Predicted AAA-ATPase/PD-(D/E)XK nuclease superfamily
MQKLSISFQTFLNVRSKNRIYVDKTMFVHRVLQEGGGFFLARPRRFGKSLFLSTMQELAEGNRTLFSGLWIDDKWDWTRRYEVLHLDFSEISFKGGLRKALKGRLLEYYKKYNITTEEDDLKYLFRDLIQEISKINPIVLLIDEYDKPILQAIEEDEFEEAEAHQKAMKEFYSVLKGNEKCFHTVFITGVTKLARVSIFSDLNHIKDISFHPDFVAAFGYTQTEVEAYFQDYFTAFLEKYPGKHTYDSLIAKVKEWYNGYSFDGKTKVYNPYGLLHFFEHLRFINSWFESGSSSFLVKRILKSPKFEYANSSANLNDLQFMNFNFNDIQILMFQSGYLTIKEIDFDNNVILDYPNREVRESLYGFILKYRDNADSYMHAPANQLAKAFHEEDLDRIQNLLQQVFLKLPYDVYTDQRPREVERFYHGIIHVLLQYIGLYVQSEVHTHKGRADAVVFAKNAIFLFEFKIGKTPQEALAQIKERNYAAQFADHNKKIYLIGANFDTEWREMEDFEVEEVGV